MRSYTYSPVGNRLSMLDDEGGTTAFQYDNSDWLTGVVYPGGQRVSYGYNSAGDRLSEQVGSSAPIVYSIDPGGRMVARASDTFSYDPDGNLIKGIEGGEESRYSWTTDNRLARVEKDLPCDRHGKRKCSQCQPKTLAEDYGYLPLDWRRVSRKADGKTFVSVFDQDDESHEYILRNGHDDDDKNDHGKKENDKDENKPRLKLLREFIGGPGTDDLEVTKYRGRTLEMLKDGLGSIIALANRGGNPVAKIAYDAWGNLKWPDKPGHGVPPCKEDELDDYLDRFEGGRSFENSGFDPWHLGRHHGKILDPYLFTGRRLDAFSQLYNNRNRQYNPRYGRFITKDPIGFEAGNNLYIYVSNNPLGWADPTGLRKATPLERMFWTSFHKSPLAKKLINNYLDDTGQGIQLSENEMVMAGVFASLEPSADFQAFRSSHSTYSGSFDFRGAGPGGAGTHGTLAYFTIDWSGSADISGRACWSFDGTMSFRDAFDFDPLYLSSHRRLPAEILVIIAHFGMPGKAFPITSVQTRVTQDSTQAEARWAGYPAASHAVGDFFADLLQLSGLR